MRRLVDWRVAIGVVVMASMASAARAQITPAAGYNPPDDTPSIRVGTTMFTDDSYTASPETTNADGNAVNASAFNAATTPGQAKAQRVAAHALVNF